jgi:hypothetical protein
MTWHDLLPSTVAVGRILRRDSEYKREGTANVFCGVEPKAGRHFTRAAANRCSPRFADCLVEILQSSKNSLDRNSVFE